MSEARALLVLGGSFHDFDGFAGVAQSVLGAAGFELEISRELTVLGELVARAPRLLVLFTCLDEQAERTHSAAELAELTRWVRAGGALLALHAATVAAAHQPELAELLGGAFAGHLPKGRFRVAPAPSAHPSTQNLEPFELEDELYRHRAPPNGKVHLLADDVNGPTPVAWSRREHAGRVYYLGLGHDSSAWASAAYRTLLVQSARWLAFEA